MKLKYVGREQGFRKSGFAAKKLAPAAAARRAIPSRAFSESVMPGSTGQQRIPVRMPAARSLRTAAEAQIRTRRARLHLTSQLDVRRGDGEVHRELVATANFSQQVDIALDQVRLGHDAQPVALLAREHLQQAARDAGPALDGLVRICRRAQRNMLRGIDPLQVLLQQPCGVLLEEDDALKRLQERAGSLWRLAVVSAQRLVSARGIRGCTGRSNTCTRTRSLDTD